MLIPLSLLVLLLQDGCGPRERPWETIESIDQHGRWKLHTRGVDRRGDLFGRGKHYDLGIKSLWHSGKVFLDHVRDLECTRDSHWAFVTSQKDPEDAIEEVLLLDLQGGTPQRKFSLLGRLMSTCMDSPGLRMAFCIQDEKVQGRIHVLVVDTTRIGFTPKTVYSGPGNVVAFPQFSWSPDSSQLAFDVVHWRQGATQFSFVHINLVPEPTVVSTRDSGGQYRVDWSDPLHPK